MIWDETLYAGAADFYSRGRLPYAPGLPSALADLLGLDGQGRLLDVGCGPGTLALSLAPLFGEDVGVDADGGMIAAAERRAAELDVRARWIRARAEELPTGLGTFTAATFGGAAPVRRPPRCLLTGRASSAAGRLALGPVRRAPAEHRDLRLARGIALTCVEVIAS